MPNMENGTLQAPVAMREYTSRQTAAANLPYAAMILLGAAIIALGFPRTPWVVGGALAYALYGVGGALWIMIFVCPYCVYFGTRGCPCGYGMMAARLARKSDREGFAQQFKRHIPVIVPLWIVPLAAGILALVQSFNPWLLGLVGLFAVNSYVVLPFLAKRHSCGNCPQREGCPWMSGKQGRPCG